IYFVMADIRGHPLHNPSKKRLIVRLKSSNDLNFTSLSCYLNAGLWNELLLGWKIIADCGRTVNEHLKIADRVAYWQV
ncbi:hypothetical protein ABE47_14020, partial [Bacillus thuringiensis]|nr:hypothetical protein [Bacillus thuringiensis]